MGITELYPRNRKTDKRKVQGRMGTGIAYGQDEYERDTNKDSKQFTQKPSRGLHVQPSPAPRPPSAHGPWPVQLHGK
jgi:hypothetical protein